MKYVKIPSHHTIKKAIRFMPWGKKVWFYDQKSNKINIGKLVGFVAATYEDEEFPIRSWVISYWGGSTLEIPVEQMFFSETQAYKWAMQNTNLSKKIKKEKLEEC